MRQMSKCFSSRNIIFFLGAIILALDQLSKWLIVRYLHKGYGYFVLPFFNIVRVENKGITFGMFSGALPSIVWISLSLIIISSLIVFVKKYTYYRIPIVLIISGAIGNVIDRIFYGAVIDFLDFHLFNYHWPAFNIADSSIFIGAMFLFFMSLKESKK